MRIIDWSSDVCSSDLRSRFEKGSGGHYLKTRAVQVDVDDNSFDDTQGKATNYMIDLPSGSVGRIANNLFVQGRDKENHSAFIAIAAEERKNPSRGLVMAGNRASLPAGIDRRWTGRAACRERVCQYESIT